MTRLRHNSPAVDRSHVLPYGSKGKRKKRKSRKQKMAVAQKRQDARETRPILNRSEQGARKEQMERLWRESNPPRLISARQSRPDQKL